ncbi:T9SS type A sorting domain-containing protein [Longitalea luteola]|uniref:T9SS type A sorting domain-containing protein n=1 Tax=Longitalea luteola TaxID=2812563 RepID=UPI001A95B7EC|nr:T9SS type A sorting domain-containing protein [Longitalea luteola]
MKKFLKILIIFLCAIAYRGYSQNCADDYTDITNNQFVCANYGDANGNSNWNWEIKPSDANYCKHWSARTSSISTKLTIMGSPFVNSPTTALDLISQRGDYTKEKGWELLQRDFGCTHVTAYPYFVLYNKFTGLIRVYIYKTETPEGFTSMLVTMEPTMPAPYPATTSLGDELAGTPAAFLNSNETGKYGKSVVAVTEQGGYTRWSVAELNPGFDPNIQNGAYFGAGVKFTIYGVVTNDLKAVIKGRSVTGTNAAIYSFSYVPKNTPTSSNGGQTVQFSAIGEKFSTFSKSISEVRNLAKTFAERVKAKIQETNPPEDGPEGKIELEATNVSNNSNNDHDFLKMLGNATSNLATGTGSAGVILKFVGEMIGLFSTGSSGKPAAMPTYTSYDMELRGSLTAKTVQQSFILRVPGTIQPNNDNATYYKCPLGIFNIKNTPEADTVIYTRVHHFQYSSCCVNTSRSDYVSYRIRNNLEVSFNSGAGLELVSAQAAIVGQILPNGAGETATASYDLFSQNEYINDPDAYYYLVRTCNFMRPDLESGRLQVTTFDTEKKLHTFQTPYVNIECVNGLAFNARKETKVWLRVKAVLKKQNDPENTPILYIHDYEIKTFQGSFDTYFRNRHNQVYSWQTPLPYSNYTETPTYVSDKVIYGIVYNQSVEEKVDNSITTEGGVDVIVPNGQSVIYKAGSTVLLQEGFEAEYGSEFEASINTFGYNISCGTLQAEAFQNPGACYNTAISGLRKTTTSNVIDETETPEILRVYPIPTTGKLFISGMTDAKNAIITILDQSGRTVRELRAVAQGSTGRLDLDVSGLQNGVYFVKIQTQAQTITKKIVIGK